jgi:hypothetical protein
MLWIGLGLAAGQEKRPAPPAPPEARVAVGKAASRAGTLLRRSREQPGWQVVRPDEPVSSTDLLLALPGEQAGVAGKSGAARLMLWSNLPEFSSFPVLESAVVLHGSSGDDLDFTLERGRVVVTRQANRAPAQVRVRFEGRMWTLVLEEPGTEVALERYGRWVPGSRFAAKAGPEDLPSVAVVVLVLRGQAALRTEAAQYRMSAPPGPAYFHWNNVSGADRGTSRREKIPTWAEKGPRQTPEAQALHKAVEEQRRALASKPVEAAILEGLRPSEPARRQVALYSLAAVDDLPHLADALAHEKDADVRDSTVPVLQAWIGRGLGQDAKLYQFLIQQRQYTPRQAETVLQLLHDFSADDRDRPETYETLIGYLRHTRPAVRELAKWYLYRWVPAGRRIAYDPAGSEAERERGYEEWKKLIPDGKLPPKGR